MKPSFLALRGASGAPVFYNQKFHVVGVIVASASYHLLPIQIETDLTDDNKLIEERKYLLPQALAVNIKHLQTDVPPLCGRSVLRISGVG